MVEEERWPDHEEEEEYSAFKMAGVMSVDAVEASPPRSSSGPRRRPKAKGKGGAKRSEDLPAGRGAYVPVPLAPKEEMAEVYAASLATADQVFLPAMCVNPFPALAAVIALLSETERNPEVSDGGKKDVGDALQFLAERVAAVTSLADPKSAPNVALLDSVPRGEGGRRRGPARTMMHDIARGLARRVPLTKLVALDGDVRPYLAALMVAAIHKAKGELIIPEDLKFRRVTINEFENMIAKDSGRVYDNYGTIAQQLGGGELAEDPAKI